MVRTQIQLTEEQVKAIKEMATARHVSSAELILRAVDVMIKSDSAGDREERRRRAMEVVGRFRSGAHDVSKKHDRYLAEAFRT